MFAAGLDAHRLPAGRPLDDLDAVRDVDERPGAIGAVADGSPRLLEGPRPDHVVPKRRRHLRHLPSPARLFREGRASVRPELRLGVVRHPERALRLVDDPGRTCGREGGVEKLRLRGRGPHDDADAELVRVPDQFLQGVVEEAVSLRRRPLDRRDVDDVDVRVRLEVVQV